MADQKSQQPRLDGGGTNQKARPLAALDPGFVKIDERGLRDMLDFARQYARELRYYDDQNQGAGTWDQFLAASLDLDEITRALEQAALSQAAEPHVALFLAFLHLLRHAQDDVNNLTRRHLDFYYRTVLGMTKKAPVADRVNVLFEPADDVEQVLVPAGTLLDGGLDSTDRPQIYRTHRDVVVGRARVEKLAAVFVSKRITGIREAREKHPGTKEEGFVRMFELAIGHPDPGDPLPKYPSGEVVNFALLNRLRAAVEYCVDPNGLAMELFELRNLVHFWTNRRKAVEWPTIHGFIQTVGRKRDAGFTLPPDSRDVEGDLASALGKKLNYAGLTLVKTLDNVYDQRFRQDVQQFILTDLKFDSLADFEQMMKLKTVDDSEWKVIHRILQDAGRRRRSSPHYTLPTDRPRDFQRSLAAALPGLAFPENAADIEAYLAALVRLEQFFHVSAEAFRFVMSLFGRAPAAAESEWLTAYGMLGKARAEKTYAARRELLGAPLQGGSKSPLERFDAVLHLALGESLVGANADPLTRLEAFIKDKADKDFLKADRAQVAAGSQIPDQDRLVRAAEVAQRNRGVLPVPVPVTEEWLNLHPCADVTKMLAAPASGDKDELPRWRTFGQSPPKEVRGIVPSPSIGWAIASPILALSEGDRTIELELDLAQGSFDPKKLGALFPAPPTAPGKVQPAAPVPEDPLRIEVSTADGWVEADQAAVVADIKQPSAGQAGAKPESTKLKLVLKLGVGVAPLVRPAANDPRSGASDPAVRIMLRQIWDAKDARFRSRYPSLEHLVITRVMLSTAVRGISTPRIQSDEGQLDPKQPFEPFGIEPAVGSRFYVGHPELVGRPIRSVDFRVEWMGVPPELETPAPSGNAPDKGHYANYAGRANFLARISALDERADIELDKAARLFDGADATKQRTISVSTGALADRPGSRKASPRPASPGDEEPDLRKWSCFLVWELAPRDFHHGEYPRLAASKAVDLAAAIASGGTVTAASYQVNPPYTPKIKRLLLDYTASVTIDLSTGKELTGQEHVLHVHPFGYERLRASGILGKGWRFLPRYGDEGELYLGIRGFRPAPGSKQRLSLLFQMAEGSADPSLARVPVRWSRLDGERWIVLDAGQVVSDTTRGLINSGILELDLEAAKPGTRLRGDLYWLRASIQRHASSVCDTIAVHAQAVSATFVDSGNAVDHYERPLAAGTITELVKDIPGVGKVLQPYTAFGGQTEERDSVFHNRVSERLRHKDRALTAWDYERLVLERFPEVYKVKCVPGGVLDVEQEPGRVDVVVIPDVRKRRPFDPFQPKTPDDLIAEVQTYLAKRTPIHAKVRVRNPHYVPVRIRLGVRFREKGNDGYYKLRLNDELNRFLSPWAFDEGADIVIGGKIYANSIIDFLDRRPYVDYVSHLMLFTSEDGRTFRRAQPSKSEGHFVSTSRADGVLVAARQHDIDLVTETGYEVESFLGIGYTRVELDFIIA